ADAPTRSEASGFTQVEQRLRLLQLVPKNALEGFMVARPCSLAPLFRRAECAEMPIADPCLRQMLGEGVLGEAFLAGGGHCTDVEHKSNPGLAERADEPIDGRALIADGEDGIFLLRR